MMRLLSTKSEDLTSTAAENSLDVRGMGSPLLICSVPDAPPVFFPRLTRRSRSSRSGDREGSEERESPKLPGAETEGGSDSHSAFSSSLSTIIGCKPSCGEGCGVVEILELKIEIGDAMLPLACAAGT